MYTVRVIFGNIVTIKKNTHSCIVLGGRGKGIESKFAENRRTTEH